MDSEELRSYIIKGGSEGRERLSVLARVMAPGTDRLFDRFEPLAGVLAIDAGCGGGDVSFDIAARVGPSGRVVGFDLDETKLDLARREAAQLGFGQVNFVSGSVLEPWPASGAGLVYVRFVLTHLTEPETLLAHAIAAMRPGGMIVVEDIDFAGHFCDPSCPAFDRYVELYAEAARRRGADAFIGRRLTRLLQAAGFADVGSSLVQPHGRAGEVKQIASLTFSAISDTVIGAGLASPTEVQAIQTELAAFAARPDTMLSMPRIFQAWGTRP